MSKEEKKLTAYAVLMQWSDGSESYLYDSDVLHTITSNGGKIRLFRTQEEAVFVGEITRKKCDTLQQERPNKKNEVKSIIVQSITI
jgi:hypothetical protein